MGHESTELSIYRYGGLQQIHHWTTWFSTAPRHRWIHLQPPEVTTDYHLDRLAAGMTPAKKRKTTNHVLYKICGDFLEYDSVLNYMIMALKFSYYSRIYSGKNPKRWSICAVKKTDIRLDNHIRGSYEQKKGFLL